MNIPQSTPELNSNDLAIINGKNIPNVRWRYTQKIEDDSTPVDPLQVADGMTVCMMTFGGTGTGTVRLLNATVVVKSGEQPLFWFVFKQDLVNADFEGDIFPLYLSSH